MCPSQIVYPFINPINPWFFILSNYFFSDNNVKYLAQFIQHVILLPVAVLASLNSDFFTLMLQVGQVFENNIYYFSIVIYYLNYILFSIRLLTGLNKDVEMMILPQE